MTMQMLLRSETLRAEERQRPETIRPKRSPEWGRQEERGCFLKWSPREPSRTPVGLEVWPGRRYSKVPAYQVPPMLTMAQQLATTSPTTGQTLALL